MAPDHNRKFHGAIIAATHNPDLRDSVEFCRVRIAPFQRVPFKSADRRAASQIEHQQIIDALENRNSELATEKMRLHLSAAAVAIDEQLMEDDQQIIG
tara:strand:- start:105 stop:398 length:294 start_codon:yes stop_codon:yes gene_type:complete